MDTPMSLMNERVSELCHLMACMKQEMSKMRECMGGLRADVCWLKRSLWWIVGLVGSALVAGMVFCLGR